MLEFFAVLVCPCPICRASSGPQRPQPDEEQPRGVGSGFILTPDGYVMTTPTWSRVPTRWWSPLTDKREFKAKIIGADKRTDGLW